MMPAQPTSSIHVPASVLHEPGPHTVDRVVDLRHRLRRPHFVRVDVTRVADDIWRLQVVEQVYCRRDFRRLSGTFELTGSDVVVQAMGRAVLMTVGSTHRRKLRMATLGYDACDVVLP